MFKKLTLSLVSLGLMVPGFALANNQQNNQNRNVSNADQQIQQQAQILDSQAHGLALNVLTLALKAYHYGQTHGMDQKKILTVVNYQLPSSEQRFWVFNVAQDKLIYSSLVAHGRNSGLLYATHFSNTPQTKESSIGVYLTKQPYYGHDGFSLRINGMDRGFNNNALSRDIVVHGASYVSKSFVKDHDRAGRSWGCFALPKSKVKNIINTIKGGTMIFAYYPNQKWLHSSKFLNYSA